MYKNSSSYILSYTVIYIFLHRIITKASRMGDIAATERRDVRNNARVNRGEHARDGTEHADVATA